MLVLQSKSKWSKFTVFCPILRL